MNKKNDKVAVEYSRILLCEGDYELATSIIDEVIKRNPTYGPAIKFLQELRKI